MGILIAIVSGFASGIFFRSLFIFSWEPILFALLLATLFGTATFLKPRLLYSVGAVFCLCVVLGMWRADVADTPLPETFATQLRQRVSYDGVVVADPDLRDASQRVEVRVTESDTSTIMLAVAPRTTTVAVGDRVRVSGTLAVPAPFAGDNGRTFAYDKYLQRDGVRFMLNFAYLRVTSPAPWYSPSAALARVKHAFLDGVNATLPEPVSSLASGIVIGGKSGLGSELQDAFIASGLVQIIVLSGYNIMVVAEWVMAALARTRLKKWWGSAAGGLAVLLFVGIAGFTATAIRAMLMAMIALYARATGKSYSAGRALLVVVFLMLVWNPLYLAFDPGFALSVAATAGLIYLAPIIEALLGADPTAPVSFWKNAIATTLAAQAAVLPLLLYFTGNLSWVAIPANVITSPIVPVAMGLSALAGAGGILFAHVAPMVGLALALPAYAANALIITIATTAAALPAAAVTVPTFPFVLVIAAYAALAYFATSSKRRSMTDQFRFARNASM